MPLPDHRNSPRLTRDALVLGPSAALNRDPTATPSVNNFSQAVPQSCVPQQFSSSPTIMCSTAIRNISTSTPRLLCGGGRELLPLRGHQQGPPTSQSGLYLYPQTKVGDILDSAPSRRRRRNFLVDAITQKWINIFFPNLVHMLRMPKGISLF